MQGTDVFYSKDKKAPLGDWELLSVPAPAASAELPDLEPRTEYFVRLRGRDRMGPGPLGSVFSVPTGDEREMRPFAGFQELRLKLGCGSLAAAPKLVLDPGPRVEVLPGKGVKVDLISFDYT